MTICSGAICTRIRKLRMPRTANAATRKRAPIPGAAEPCRETRASMAPGEKAAAGIAPARLFPQRFDVVGCISTVAPEVRMSSMVSLIA